MDSSLSKTGSLVGSTLGRYEVQALVGRGAQGLVYLARDVVLNRLIALKVLIGNQARDAEAVRAFHEEARTAAPLRHHNIVRVYSAGIQDGIPYIAMEYVPGEPLDRFLKRLGQMSWASALGVTKQVADALDFAHRNGVVHRDVKPANILLDRAGRAHLTDFGVANRAAANPPAGAESSQGFAGTLHYTSPEQCGGGEVGSATDLYALGVTLFRMIAGRLPFEGDSPVALIKSITTEEPPRLNKLVSDVPDDVVRLVAHLMAKDPKGRPPDAASLARTIERVLAEGGGRSAMPDALAAFVKEQAETPAPRAKAAKARTGSARHKGRSGQRKRRGLLRGVFQHVAVMGLVLLVAACALAAYAGRQFNGPDRSPREAPAMGALEFEAVGPGVMLARLPYERFRFDHVSWVGDKPVLLVYAVDAQTGHTDGAAGVLAVDAESHRCWSVLAPSSPSADAAFWQTRLPIGAHRHPPAGQPGARFDAAILLEVCAPRGDSNSFDVLTVAQRWNETAPRPEVLFRASAQAWLLDSQAPWKAASYGCAVPSPDGLSLCLVLNDPAQSSNYLVERNVQWQPPERVGPPLTAPGAAIIPESVQYSPDGSRIAYVRQTSERNRELWIVRTGGLEVNGTLLAAGALGDQYAFSPDGQAIVAMAQPGDGVDPELRVISVSTSHALGSLGNGFVGPESWNRSRPVVVVASAADQQGRLWAVNVRDPLERTALVHLKQALSTPAAVSPDGRWAAAGATTGKHPAIVLVDLASKSAPGGAAAQEGDQDA